MSELYAWYKEHGRCPKCGGDPVRGGIYCINCLERQRENARKYRSSWSNEKKVKVNQDNRDRVKKIRTERIKKGICIDCGKHIVYAGTQRCGICRNKLNKRNRERWQFEKGGRSYEERIEHDKCYICGAPALKGKRTCAKCLEREQKLAENMRTYIKQSGFERKNLFWRGESCGADKK